MSKVGTTFPEIEKAVKELLKVAISFDERAKSIEISLKFATLKMKAKGNNFGKGFDEPEGGDDEDY